MCDLVYSSVAANLCRRRLEVEVPDEKHNEDAQLHLGKFSAWPKRKTRSAYKMWTAQGARNWDDPTANDLPKQPRGPSPKGKLGPALGSKTTSPFSPCASQRSGMKRLMSVASHMPILSLASRELSLRRFSSTASAALLKLGPFVRQKTSVPLGM